MLVGMKDSTVKFLINGLAACQDKKKTFHAEESRSLVFKFSSFQENTLHAERSSSLVFHFMKKDVSHFLNCSESVESGSHSLHLKYSFQQCGR